MTIEATKQELIEADVAAVRTAYPDKFWKKRHVKVGPVPPEQNFALVALALAPAVTEDDHDPLVAAIQAIPGIQRALVTIWGQTMTIDKFKPGCNLYVNVESEYDFVPVPE